MEKIARKIILVNFILTIAFFVGYLIDMFDEGSLLYFMYFELAFASFLILSFGIQTIVKNSDSFKKIIVGFIVFILIASVSWFFSSETMMHFKGSDKFNLSPMSIKVVGASLTFVYVLFFLSVAGILFSEIHKYIKK